MKERGVLGFRDYLKDNRVIMKIRRVSRGVRRVDKGNRIASVKAEPLDQP